MKHFSIDSLKEESLTHNKKIKKKVFIKKGQIKNLIKFSQAYLKAGQISSEHIHEDLTEVFLIESGTGIVKVDGKVNQIKAGDCIIIEPGEGHEYLNTGTEELILTFFGIKK